MGDVEKRGLTNYASSFMFEDAMVKEEDFGKNLMRKQVGKEGEQISGSSWLVLSGTGGIGGAGGFFWKDRPRTQFLTGHGAGAERFYWKIKRKNCSLNLRQHWVCGNAASFKGEIQNVFWKHVFESAGLWCLILNVFPGGTDAV